MMDGNSAPLMKEIELTQGRPGGRRSPRGARSTIRVGEERQ